MYPGLGQTHVANTGGMALWRQGCLYAQYALWARLTLGEQVVSGIERVIDSMVRVCCKRVRVQPSWFDRVSRAQFESRARFAGPGSSSR